MRKEFDANLSLQPMDRKPCKPCKPEAIEHYRPGGEWALVIWCAGVIAGGALLGFLAGVVSAYL